MDECLKKALHVLFHVDKPQEVIINSNNNLPWPYSKELVEEDLPYSQKHCMTSSLYRQQSCNEKFSKALDARYQDLSGDEVNNIVSLISGLDHGNRKDFKTLGVFLPLFKFAERTLQLDDGQPVIKFERLLAFREVSLDISPEIIVCAYLADYDFKHGRRHRNFTFPTSLPTDNIRLQNMLKVGLAENHFHLKGSAHAENLSWIYVMNNVRGMKEKYKKVSPDEPIKPVVTYAAAVRQYFFRMLQSKDKDFKNCRKALEIINQCIKSINSSSEIMIDAISSNLQSEINVLKMIGRLNVNGMSAIDYAITNISDDSAYTAFSGERQFLYEMFYSILKGEDWITDKKDWFYAYLIIRAKFREKLIQDDEKAGFANFDDFQCKKGIFFKNNKKFEDLQVELAFAAALDSKSSNIKSLEARIIPGQNPTEISAGIRRDDILAAAAVRHLNGGNLSLENQIVANESCRNSRYKNVQHNQKYFYVAHFPKKPDDLDSEQFSYVYCRHFRYLNSMEKEAIAICRFREGDSLEARRLYGIDACSDEIICRPEVFGQSFRFLKAHHVDSSTLFPQQPDVPPLRTTYHVGEDFLDIADGLRAVDEAIEFLNLSHGDRIGHGTVLGIDAAYWYKSRNYAVVLKRQDIIDNCAWLLAVLDQCGGQNFKVYPAIKDMFRKQLNYVYACKNSPISKRLGSVSYCDYMDAWHLRGDNPYLYSNIHNEDIKLNYEKSFFHNANYGFYAKNKPHDDSLNIIRDTTGVACLLYNMYHFSRCVRDRGGICYEVEITPEYIKAVETAQNFMREKITHMDIGIECNPSSNVKIGGFKRYDKHPIFKFYNKGLVPLEKEARMFVSINTDDLGVFDTSLENEYALLACALNMQKDDSGNYVYTPTQIYQYLDEIRKMSLQQSFYSNL